MCSADQWDGSGAAPRPALLPVRRTPHRFTTDVEQNTVPDAEALATPAAPRRLESESEFLVAMSDGHDARIPFEGTAAQSPDPDHSGDRRPPPCSEDHDTLPVCCRL